MTDNITIKQIKQKVINIEKNADQILFKADGDKYIRQFIELKEFIEAKEKEIKHLIEKKALEMDKNFKSIRGDEITAIYSTKGNKYYFDKKIDIKEIGADFIKESVRYTPNSKEIEKFTKEQGALPRGIMANEIKGMIFKRKKAK